jgi:hypothetical protein
VLKVTLGSVVRFAEVEDQRVLTVSAEYDLYNLVCMDALIDGTTPLGDTDMHSAVVRVRIRTRQHPLLHDTSGGVFDEHGRRLRPATKQPTASLAPSRKPGRGHASRQSPPTIEGPHVPAGDARDSVVEVAITAEA